MSETDAMCARYAQYGIDYARGVCSGNAPNSHAIYVGFIADLIISARTLEAEANTQ